MEKKGGKETPSRKNEVSGGRKYGKRKTWDKPAWGERLRRNAALKRRKGHGGGAPIQSYEGISEVGSKERLSTYEHSPREENRRNRNTKEGEL